MDEMKHTPDPVGFVRELLTEHYWPDCFDIDGALIHDLAVKYDVVEKVKFDPVVHGEGCDYIEPGDDWYVLHPSLEAKPTSHNRKDGRE